MAGLGCAPPLSPQPDLDIEPSEWIDARLVAVMKQHARRVGVDEGRALDLLTRREPIHRMHGNLAPFPDMDLARSRGTGSLLARQARKFEFGSRVARRGDARIDQHHVLA